MNPKDLIAQVKTELNADTRKNVLVRTGSEIKYVDPTDSKQFVTMPSWFQELTTIPGVPYRFITEFVGRPNSGKTSAGMLALISAQQSGAVSILVDAERKFSYTRFANMGGDPDSMIVISNPSIEENFHALENIQRKIHEADPDSRILVLYDSIAVGATRAELEKDITDNATVADQARVVKRGIRRQLALIQDCNCAFIVINQTYSQIGTMSYGEGQKASGGQGLEYAKALAVNFTRIADKKSSAGGVERVIGIVSKIKCTKNHLIQGDGYVKDLEIEVTANQINRKGEKVEKAEKAPKGRPAKKSLLEDTPLDDELIV